MTAPRRRGEGVPSDAAVNPGRVDEPQHDAERRLSKLTALRHARPVTEARNGRPLPRPYVWRRGDAEREADIAAEVDAAEVAAAQARIRKLKAQLKAELARIAQGETT